jgi:hypothetical protein
MVLYIDGVEAASKPSQGGQLQTGAPTPVRVGGSGFIGVVDEPAVWSRALTAAEIAAIASSAGAKCG